MQKVQLWNQCGLADEVPHAQAHQIIFHVQCLRLEVDQQGSAGEAHYRRTQRGDRRERLDGGANKLSLQRVWNDNEKQSF